MVEWQKEWQNGRMAEMDTYLLFMVHADTDTDDDTLIFYSIDLLPHASMDLLDWFRLIAP